MGVTQEDRIRGGDGEPDTFRCDNSALKGRGRAGPLEEYERTFESRTLVPIYRVGGGRVGWSQLER